MTRINCHSAFKHYEMFHSGCHGGGNYGSSRQSAPARNDAPAGGSSFAEFDDGEGELPF